LFQHPQIIKPRAALFEPAKNKGTAFKTVPQLMFKVILAQSIFVEGVKVVGAEQENLVPKNVVKETGEY
jgi:hypothetical protein